MRDQHLTYEEHHNDDSQERRQEQQQASFATTNDRDERGDASARRQSEPAEREHRQPRIGIVDTLGSNH